MLDTRSVCMAVMLCASMFNGNQAYARTPDSVLETTVVTATREEKPRREVPESVDVILSEDIDFVSPAHPAEILNRSAGVHINNLGGEGHMTAIRQPITTGGVYLFLEDGLPTRPTGLFNHNALYEINLPQAERIEVIKGPGSALYGSDSIGGIINSITQPSPDKLEYRVNPEVGSFGWKRLLTSVGAPINQDTGFRVDLNITDNEGYRDESEYSRYSTTARIDGFISSDIAYKSILSITQVEQSGVSGLEEIDYRNNPKKNLYHNDLGRREVDALRISTEFAYEPDAQSLYTLTPFFRDNQMKLMPSWMLSYDPNDRDYQFQSYGFLAKYRRKQADLGIEWILGIDVDYTPSTYEEVRLSTLQDGDIFIGTFETGRINYDFKADQISVSPYIHTEWQVTEPIRLTAGLRYDFFEVDYRDQLPEMVEEVQSGRGGFRHFRPDSQTLSYDRLSPKLGVIYLMNTDREVYANYRQSFRVPSIGQLFRSGSTTNSVGLKPVRTESVELGARGRSGPKLNYDVAIYYMRVKDDIVSFIDTSTDERRVTNAGETQHKGIELGFQGALNDSWGYRAAWSIMRQEYKDYTALFGFPTTEINYAGNRVGKAPETLGNFVIQYQPSRVSKLNLEFEWEHLGEYFTDETNDQRYGGHDLLNIRARYQVNSTLAIYGRILNAQDKRYSTYTRNQVGDPDIQYRPGLPRAFFVGLNAKF